MKPIFFLGDVHGNLSDFFKKIEKYDIKDCYVIQVGDLGFSFEMVKTKEIYLQSLTESLQSKEGYLDIVNHYNDIFKERNIEFFAIRGNHDNPSYFLGYEEFTLSNFRFISDYSVLKINERNILFIGGAISIDRKTRKRNISYWENEKFFFDLEKIKSIRNIDTVVTHTAPNFLSSLKIKDDSLVHHYAERDGDLLGDLNKESYLLCELYKELSKNNKIKSWMYGHFHSPMIDSYNETNFRCVNINELIELV